MADGLGRQRPPHEQPDVQRLADLHVRRALVEDLLDAVVDSVEAVLRDRHRQRGQLLVLLRERAIGEDLPAEVTEARVDLQGRLEHQPVEPLLLRVPLVYVQRLLLPRAG